MFNPHITIIGGCGHVGFPLGLSFSRSGKKVALLDIDEIHIRKINEGKVPFKEEGAQELLSHVLKEGTLYCTSDSDVIRRSEFVIVVTGTPLDEHLNPRNDIIFNVLDQYFMDFQENQTLILRSTLYPTTSQKINEYFKKRGKKIHVTFCPERIIEGQALKEIAELPQIVSGFSHEGIEKVKELFLLLTKKVIHLSPLEAELTKLFANSYRYIHFAIANQFYQIASFHDVDFSRIYHAMGEDYPRMKNFPKPGFTAGPCLLKDTMQLSSFTKQHFYLGHAAMLVNENMPRMIIDKIKKNIDIQGKSIGILGMAFKAESDDKRDSLSYKLARLLKYEEMADVHCSDEYISDKTFISKEKLLELSDIIIIAAPHEVYKNMDFKGKYIFDIWNV